MKESHKQWSLCPRTGMPHAAGTIEPVVVSIRMHRVLAALYNHITRQGHRVDITNAGPET